MGQSDLHDYTIQADFKVAADATAKLPDVGVIAQGYTLEVSGENKWLKLMSWMPHDKRTFKELTFDLKPNVWYTLKLRAANVDGKAAAARQDLEARRQGAGGLDDRADRSRARTRTGAPGMFGNATNAELFIDNVSVTSNSAELSRRLAHRSAVGALSCDAATDPATV